MIFCHIDVDECVLDMPCDENARCSNSGGGFNCTCNRGYSGNGEICIGMFLIITFIVNLMNARHCGGLKHLAGPATWRACLQVPKTHTQSKQIIFL